MPHSITRASCAEPYDSDQLSLESSQYLHAIDVKAEGQITKSHSLEVNCGKPFPTTVPEVDQNTITTPHSLLKVILLVFGLQEHRDKTTARTVSCASCDKLHSPVNSTDAPKEWQVP